MIDEYYCKAEEKSSAFFVAIPKIIPTFAVLYI